MSHMLPEGGEVMRRAACGDVCPAPPAPPAPPALHNRTSENKELLRQQLLSAGKERGADRPEPPRSKHARSRQKNRWKLKFHHQALPQEYLDHYEQSLQKAAKQKKAPEKPKESPDVNFTSESFKLWAQRLASIPGEPGTPPGPAAALDGAKPKTEEKKKKNPAIAPSKIVTYEDLPYMGEMTLNDSKPRRGRKPKKADICHLIYENYGTVVPGQPPARERPPAPGAYPPFKNSDAAASTPKTDLQNKLIFSLLERKLSQERRRLETLSPPRFCSPDEPMPEAPATAAGPLHSDDEPLNLCIRDLRDLKLQIQRKFGDIYASAPEVKAELEEGSERDGARGEQPNAISVIQRNTSVAPAARGSPDPARAARPASPASEPPDDDEPPGLAAWPRAGVYVHPLALQAQLLYYQRLAAAGRLPLPGEGREEPPAPPELPPDDGRSKLVLKQIGELLDPKVVRRAEAARTPEPGGKRASPNPVPGPAKRKRSAIFIPPIPTKTGPTAPTTEVSICKFKFTGGSKPSLQEKKMLSVDSGGNFRYYSGTGSKAGRGSDGPPRAAQARPAGPPEPAAAPLGDGPAGEDDASKKKRKSRKTLQREKLERTFKEKGFLIQTQQLQSAEGATYCKFRQLRKFTRYLFRSWKDYLPGELEERPADGPAPGPGGDWG